MFLLFSFFGWVAAIDSLYMGKATTLLLPTTKVYHLWAVAVNPLL
jgi:hypothetical protein